MKLIRNTAIAFLIINASLFAYLGVKAKSIVIGKIIDNPAKSGYDKTVSRVSEFRAPEAAAIAESATTTEPLQPAPTVTKQSGADNSAPPKHLSLGSLFILDQLFKGNSNGLLSPDGPNLGDLFVLDQLFGSQPDLISDRLNRLGDLFVLDQLFKGNSNGLLSPDGPNLGDLFILDQLFNVNMIN